MTWKVIAWMAFALMVVYARSDAAGDPSQNLAWAWLLGILGKLGTAAKAVGSGVAAAGKAAGGAVTSTLGKITGGGAAQAAPQLAAGPTAAAPTFGTPMSATASKLAGALPQAQPSMVNASAPSALPTSGTGAQSFGQRFAPDASPGVADARSMIAPRPTARTPAAPAAKPPGWYERFLLGKDYASKMTPEQRNRAQTSGTLRMLSGFAQGKPFAGMADAREAARETAESDLAVRNRDRFHKEIDRRLSSRGMTDAQRTSLEAMRTDRTSYTQVPGRRRPIVLNIGGGQAAYHQYNDQGELERVPDLDTFKRYKPSGEGGLTESQKRDNRSMVAAREDWKDRVMAGEDPEMLSFMYPDLYENSHESLYGESMSEYEDYRRRESGFMGYGGAPETEPRPPTSAERAEKLRRLRERYVY